MSTTGATGGGHPSVSVVIPTRDRPRPLGACLDALAAQQGSPPFEVVVVDDASVDADAVASVAEQHGARLVRTGGRGPAAARNRGIREAAAPVVCLTDDDCRPGPGWLAALARRVGDGARVVAGPTRVGRPDDPYAAAAQTVTNHLVAAPGGPLPRRVAFAPTSNLAVRRDVAEALPFDESYPLAAGEDRDWCLRLEADAVPIDFEPEAWVDHLPDLDLGRFWRQQLRYGRGAAHLRSARPSAGGLQGPAFYLGLLRSGFSQGVRVGALVTLAQVATAAGVAAERTERRRRGPV